MELAGGRVREEMLLILPAYAPPQGPLGPNLETNIPLVSFFIVVCFFVFLFLIEGPLLVLLP